VRLVRASNPRLPALRRLERRMLAAQLQPPAARPVTEGQLFLARVDKLLDMGATGAAKELLQTAGPGDPERFRRLFDIGLLSRDEAHACEIMDRTPGVAPSFPARIFCLALGGDWAAAALVFHGAEMMGKIDPQMATLLAHYLDDGYSDRRDRADPAAGGDARWSCACMRRSASRCPRPACRWPLRWPIWTRMAAGRRS
jgi:hypothetical protein